MFTPDLATQFASKLGHMQGNLYMHINIYVSEGGRGAEFLRLLFGMGGPASLGPNKGPLWAILGYLWVTLDVFLASLGPTWRHLRPHKGRDAP